MNTFYIVTMILIMVAIVINLIGIIIHLLHFRNYKKKGYSIAHNRILITRVTWLILGLLIILNFTYWLEYSIILLMNILNPIVMLLIAANLYLPSVTPYNRDGIIIRKSIKIDKHILIKYSDIKLETSRNRYFFKTELIPKGKPLQKPDYDKMMTFKNKGL